MDGISARPHPGANPAGPLFQNNTMGFIGKQTEAGTIDDFEKSKLQEIENAIRQKVEQDKAQGTKPEEDRELAAMQIQMRQMSDAFANFNPETQQAAGTDEATKETN
jgi:hypothetical protein